MGLAALAAELQLFFSNFARKLDKTDQCFLTDDRFLRRGSQLRNEPIFGDPGFQPVPLRKPRPAPFADRSLVC